MRFVFSRSFFSIASSTEADASIRTVFPLLIPSGGASHTVLPATQDFLSLVAASHSADDCTPMQGNRSHFYEFQQSDDAEVGEGAGSMDGAGRASAVHTVLTGALPRGMTTAKQLMEEAVLADSSSSDSGSRSKLAVCVLGKFCAEGDNSSDGRQLGEYVLKHVLPQSS